MLPIRPKITHRALRELTALVTDKSQPNTNALAEIAHSVRILELNVKHFGYDLARRLAAALPIPEDTAARHVGLTSKPTTQTDIESDWAAHWASELKTPVVYHRKQWELAYVLQALHEHGHIAPGTRGLGFGCGREPLPSYFAAHGVDVTVTDMAHEEAVAAGWASTGQYAGTLNNSFHPQLVDRATFAAKVAMRIVDMNAIPADLVGYDFCWSMCAVEHLGSIAKGLDFLENALDTLRPGGLSVHTLEFNTEADGPTIDDWQTVLFQRRHIEAIAARLRARGHDVAPLDFDAGDQPMDRFIDLPPWSEEVTARLGDPLHLKLGIGGFVSTCFGMIVRKAC